MANVDYKTLNRRQMDQYIYPDREDAGWGGPAMAAASLYLFFAPGGKKLMGKALGGIFKGGKGIGYLAGRGYSKAVGAIPRIAAAAKGAGPAGKSFVNRLAGFGKGAGMVGAGAGMGVGMLGLATGKRLLAGSRRGAGFLMKHPGAVGAGIVGAGLFGGVRAGLKRDPALRRVDVGRGNPEIGRAIKQPGQRLRPGHLGATGDLAFSLHQGR